MKKQQLLIYFSSFIILSVFLFSSSQAEPVDIKHSMSTGHKKWHSAFTLEIKTQLININLNISLLTPKKINRVQLQEKIKLWQEAIDKTWNNQFHVLINNKKIPIKFNVKFTHFKPHHQVIIHPGQSVPNQHNWYINGTAFIAAHEVGHMIGAYDEYRGGALSPNKPLIDTSSIMGSKPVNANAYTRHLHLVQKKLIEQLNNKEIIIKSIFL